MPIKLQMVQIVAFCAPSPCCRPSVGSRRLWAPSADAGRARRVYSRSIWALPITFVRSSVREGAAIEVAAMAQREVAQMSGPSLPLQGMIRLSRSGAMATDNPGLPGDVIAVVGPSIYLLPPGVPKGQAEDIQMASFADALALAEGIDSRQVTWTRGIDQDAPDITVTVGEDSMEIELTALTAGALRAERRRLSDVAEQVRDAIAGQTDLSAALAGWTVDLSDAAALPMPTKSGAPATAARITALLATLAPPGAAPSPPRGGGTGVAAADTPEDPQGAGDAAARSPDMVDGIRVRLVRDGTAGVRVVTRASQASVTLSEARSKLFARLLDKNSKMRENVVICAGDPDRDGLVLPLDVTEFELLAVFGCGELPPTPYVKRAWLHLADTSELIPLVRVGKPQ
jgi:hypothetical protein